MNNHTHLAEIASDNSKLFKEAYIAKLAEMGNDEFFKGLRLALDNYDTFGVKKIPTRSAPDGPGVPMETFVSLCESLISRELTGGDAKFQIEFLMKNSKDSEWNGWYRRILMKDLKAGFSETTVNKAVKKVAPHYMIPIFGCQLAQSSDDHPGEMVGQKFIDVKFDGARCLTFVHPDGRVYQLSRNGKELENFPVIKEQFEKVAEHLIEPYVFDGEIMSDSFQDLMKQFKRKGHNAVDAVYYMFDALPLAEFRAGKSTLPQARRTAWLQKFYLDSAHELLNCVAVGTETVDFGTVAGEARFKKINEDAIAGGYEGIMIKDPDAFYETKRTKAWLKKKPVITVTLPIISVAPGKPDSKYADVMGALECAGRDGDDPRIIEVSCGGGFSDEQRKRYWAIRKQLPGVLAEIEADAITQNQNGTYSLRFPRFKNFRGNVPGEKI